MIRLRAAPYDSSTAAAHGIDIEELLSNVTFYKSYTCESGTTVIKSVICVELDGGPDENVRFDKSVFMWLIIFLKHDFDTIIIIQCYPGMSALNKVERFMPVINKAMNGIILDPFQFGKHLTSSGDCK
eukprot:224254_1